MSDTNLEYDWLVKLVMVGDEGAGKSCILSRYVDDIFQKSYIATIGVDFRIKTIQLDGQNIKLQIWDTAGQDRFRTITSAYFRGAHGIVLVYDITDRHSFDNVCSRWVHEVNRYAHDNICKILVGNKSDLVSHRTVDIEEAKEEADALGIPFLETSAFNGSNVEEIFQTLVRIVRERKQVWEHLSTHESETGEDTSSKKSSSICNLL